MSSLALLAFRVFTPITVLSISLIVLSVVLFLRSKKAGSLSRMVSESLGTDDSGLAAEEAPSADDPEHLPLSTSSAAHHVPSSKKLVAIFFLLSTLTYTFDSIIFILRVFVDGIWESQCGQSSEQTACTWIAEEWYLAGGILAFGAIASLLVWETTQPLEKHPKAEALSSGFLRYYTVLAAAVGTLGEAVILLLVLLSIHQEIDSGTSPYLILHVVSQSIRVLLLLSAAAGAVVSAHEEREGRIRLPEDGEVSNGNGNLDEQVDAGEEEEEDNEDWERLSVSTDGSGEGKDTKPKNKKKGGDGADAKEKKKKVPFTVANVTKRFYRLFPYLWPSKSFRLQVCAFLSLACTFTSVAFNIVEPMLWGRIVQSLSEGNLPVFYLLIWGAARMILHIIDVVEDILWAPVDLWVSKEMELMAMRHVLSLTYHFHMDKNSGELIEVLNAAYSIEQFANYLLFHIMPAVIQIPVALGYILAFFGPLPALDVLITATVYLLVIKWTSELNVKMRRRSRRTSNEAAALRSDAVQNHELIKLHSAEEREVATYNACRTKLQERRWRTMLWTRTSTLLTWGAIELGVVIGSFIVAADVAAGRRSIGDFTVFASYLWKLISPIATMGYMQNYLQTVMADTDRFMELLDEKPELPDAVDAIDLDPEHLKGEIAFSGVTFSYDDGKTQALKGISFNIPAGTSAALVGPSGSGKSTVFRLIDRFLEVADGSITIDGIDIRNITRSSLRNAIGVVPQEPSHFNASVGKNIHYGSISATREEVQRAAASARIHDKIMTFKKKYRTTLGERGGKLSGGERQRVAIARTILKNARILLLDEATSALDTATERQIQQAFKTLTEGKTSIAIAHRLSTIAGADKIIVMKEGEVIEEGRHHELLAKGGLYKELWEAQVQAETEAMEFADKKMDIEERQKAAAAKHAKPSGSE